MVFAEYKKENLEKEILGASDENVAFKISRFVALTDSGSVGHYILLTVGTVTVTEPQSKMVFYWRTELGGH